MTSAITPRYPNAASDPRLINTADKYFTLREQIRDKEFSREPVTNAERDKLATLKQALNDDKHYTPNFWQIAHAKTWQINHAKSRLSLRWLRGTGDGGWAWPVLFLSRMLPKKIGWKNKRAWPFWLLPLMVGNQPTKRRNPNRWKKQI